LKGRLLDLKRCHASPCQAVQQTTTDCASQFIVYNEKAANVWWGETKASSRRENLVSSSAVIISVHSQQLSFAKDLGKYSLLRGHTVLKQGKLNCSLLAHTTGI